MLFCFFCELGSKRNGRKSLLKIQCARTAPNRSKKMKDELLNKKENISLFLFLVNFSFVLVLGSEQDGRKSLLNIQAQCDAPNRIAKT